MNFPDGFQSKYFINQPADAKTLPAVSVAEADEAPHVEEVNGVLYIPYFVSEETRPGMEEGEPSHTSYSYLVVKIAYRGENIEDEVGLKLKRYADIRKALYGKLEHQLEMRDDRVWDKHWAAVRKAVRNPMSGTIRKWYSRYEALAALQADETLFNQVFTLYKTNDLVNLWWNSVNEICLDDPKFKEIVQTVGLTDQEVTNLVALINNAPAQAGTSSRSAS